MAASYSYDGMCLLIDAIKLAGEQDREKIQNSLKSIVMKGITGTIRFDERGKRSGSLGVSEIKDGMPVIPD
jgi:ABC-type branched-subunit amino acid transport system substrate-binding protein